VCSCHHCTGRSETVPSALAKLHHHDHRLQIAETVRATSSCCSGCRSTSSGWRVRPSCPPGAPTAC
jgi:hypothetical protein